MQGGRPGRGELLLKAPPDLLIGAREAEVAERGPDVEAGAAGQHRDLAPGLDVVNDADGEGLVFGDARGLGNVPDVQQVVRDALAPGGGQLGGADVHAAVQLRRVGVDQLPAEDEYQG